MWQGVWSTRAARSEPPPPAEPEQSLRPGTPGHESVENENEPTDEDGSPSATVEFLATCT